MPPEAVSVTFWPLQIVALEVDAVTGGGTDDTVTATVAVPDPQTPVPVTVYVVEAVGFTTMLEVVCVPGDQE